MLTDDEVAELTALRARAFGPDADLSDDPRGLARLNELEDRARAPAPDGPAPSEASEQDGSPPAPVPSAAAPVDDPASSDHASAPSSTAVDEAPPPVVPPVWNRRTWSRRAVLLIGIPVVAVACAAAAGVGAVAASRAVGTPTPSTTLAASYVASLRSVSEMHTWDAGSPRLLGDLDRTLVWEGTTEDGSVTCVVVDNVPGGPISTCQATDALTTGGVGVSVSDPRSQAVRTYVAWPNGAPRLTYTTDDPNPSP
jgi:hypothetical protein